MNVPVIAFHGLGAMGWPMAQRFKQKGWPVLGLDTDAATQGRWIKANGEAVPSLADVTVVLVCVPGEAASRQVFAQGLARWQRGALVIELGSVSHTWALQAAAQCAAAGLRYADAPLSGGVARAQTGELVAMMGAEGGDVEAVRAVLAPCAAVALHVGPPGAGQLCKMANQLAIAGVAAGLAQAQTFSREAGLDMATVLKVLSLGTAASAQLSHMQATLADPENQAVCSFGWLRKDLALCQQASVSPLPLAELWQTWWQELPLPAK